MPTNRKPILRHLHVVDRYRWNRAKSLVAFGCFVGAVIAIGGLEGEREMPNPGLAVVLICIAGVILYRVDSNWGQPPKRCAICKGYCTCD